MANQVLYGFLSLADRFAEDVTDVGIDVINEAVDATLTEHNRQLNALTALFADSTTEYTRRYKTPGAARLQPVDEFGRALPIKAAGYYDIAFPIQSAGTAWGQTWLHSQKSTVEDVNRVMSTIVGADGRWMRDHILAALFANASWTFADEEYGNLTIKGLANGDTDTYLIQTGAEAGTTDTHYLAQANAIDDGSDDPFDAIYEELKEHPENSGEVLVMVPTAQKSAVEGLSNFYPESDPNLRSGSGVTELTGSLNVSVPGKMIGYHSSGCWISEWAGLPSGYLVAVTTGGDRPLTMRQEPQASLQGFNRVAERNDYPYYQSQYLRMAGFGAQNRVGALVYRVGSGSYAVPTNYGSPMP